MDATTASLIKAKDIASTKLLFSDLLWSIVQRYGSTFKDVQQYDGYDLNEGFLVAKKGSALVKDDLYGIQHLINAKRIDFYTLTTQVGAIFDITRFVNLEYLSTSSPSSNVNFFTGDISGLINLKYVGNLTTQCKFVNNTGSFSSLTKLINFTYSGLFTIPINISGKNILPIVGNNPNIKYFDVSGNYQSFTTNQSVGDLANCPLLNRFSLTNESTPTSVCDYILQRLLVQKQAGGAITYIKLNGTITNTTTKNALIALGVSVTTL